MPRDIDDSVLADDLLLAMPRPPARLCAREAAGGSKGCVVIFFCDVETLVRIGVSLKNPLTIFGLYGYLTCGNDVLPRFAACEEIGAQGCFLLVACATIPIVAKAICSFERI